MKLVTFELDTQLGPARRLGAIEAGRVIDANLAYRHLLRTRGLSTLPERVADAVLPAEMLTFLDTGRIAWDALRQVVDEHRESAFSDVDADGSRIVWDLDAVRLLAPLPIVRSLRECGLFEGHSKTMGDGLPEIWYKMPLYWKGNPNAIQGTDTTIPWPSFTFQMDFELEIAAVIGKKGINIAEADAMEYIAGFTIFNDASARDQQRLDLSMPKGPNKSKDFCNVFGPALVTPDEVDPSCFSAVVRVNGEEWARTRTDAMNFSWAELIAHISRDEEIVPGDILTSGTVTGCSAWEHLHGNLTDPLMKPGDLIELEVDGLGVLRNRIGQPPHKEVRPLGRP